MAAGHDAHDDHGHDAHGHDDHDDHGHGGHDDHGSGGDGWVVPPIVIGLVIGIILIALFGLESGAAAYVH